MANVVHFLARARPDSCVFTCGSQQKYCVALSEKSWCDSSVCDEYMLFSLAKWLGIHLTSKLEGMDPPPTNRPYWELYIDDLEW